MATSAEELVPEPNGEQLIEWSDKLSVGIQEIDEQHKTLVSLLNQLHDAIIHQHGAEQATQILDRLYEYTQIHFAVEESLLRILDYPDYEEHKEHHELLLSQVKQLYKKLQGGNQSISFELLHFLKKWLTIHILEEDKAYTEHLLSCGAKASYRKSSWMDKFWSSLHK